MTTELATIVQPAPLTQTSADPRPVRAYLQSLGSEASRVSMRANLLRAARVLAAMAGRPAPEDPESVLWHRMQPAHVDALAARLGDEYSPATANVTLSAVRGVLRAAERLDVIGPQELGRLTQDHNGKAHKVKGNTPETGRHLSPGEIATLFRAAADDEHASRGARDAALLAVLDGGGLRRAEAVSLDVADVNLDAGTVVVRRGKGRKARTVPLAAGADDAIRGWLRHRGDEAGPLFRSVNKGGRILDNRLPARGVQRILDRLADAAGVASFTAHDFRRTVAGDLLDAGADIVTVQKILGHANPETTARYDRRPAEARRKAARLRAVPYRVAA